MHTSQAYSGFNFRQMLTQAEKLGKYLRKNRTRIGLNRPETVNELSKLGINRSGVRIFSGAPKEKRQTVLSCLTLFSCLGGLGAGWGQTGFMQAGMQGRDT